MDFDNIFVKKEESILFIVFNRPESLNALNNQTMIEFETALKGAIEEKEVKGIIITGCGEKSFIAGADIKEFAGFTKSEGRKMVENGQRILRLIETSPKPVIAAVNGYAMGGGCELAMACHLRIGTENAVFSQPEVKLGIIPGYGGTQRIIQLIGKGKAYELLLTGDSINACEAQKLGLLNYVTTQTDLIPKAKDVLQKILRNSTLAITGVINCINGYYSFQTDGYINELDEFEKCFGSDDFYEGTSAFIDKRKPCFLNK